MNLFSFCFRNKMLNDCLIYFHLTSVCIMICDAWFYLITGMIEITNSQSSLPPIVTVEEGTKVWHLVKHDDSQNVPRTQKVISEIFLTRLLATKVTACQHIYM